MRIETMFEKKKPVLSFEIFPPKRGTAIKSIDATLEILCDLKPDFISVTFGAGGSATDSLTVELARKIKYNYGIEPLVHLICLNYTRDEITDILVQLEDIGIENILALRGDVNKDVEPKKDFIYASDLVTFIKAFGSFGISGACYPEGHIEATSMKDDVRHLRHKVECGVSHLTTQMFFDNEIFYEFLENIRHEGINIPVEAGIMPVINKAQIERMTSLCGATLPYKFRRMLNKYADRKEALFDAGMAYAINQIVDLVANDTDGIHIYTMNNPNVAKRICESIKNLL